MHFLTAYQDQFAVNVICTYVISYFNITIFFRKKDFKLLEVIFDRVFLKFFTIDPKTKSNFSIILPYHFSTQNISDN